ncbi:hypothetical protein B6N60_00999 [Richelia sinica FACHB-800]|uniref:Uncharacterized protein n=1 Tax=Richelia sinica FACHB-800 TaxID=1357546 RepID=A0A975Y3P7_9NOST|nr:hypothetical protein B6N60_00999 [Richelia sinica FACHB-800]
MNGLFTKELHLRVCSLIEDGNSQGWSWHNLIFLINYCSCLNCPARAV